MLFHVTSALGHCCLFAWQVGGYSGLLLAAPTVLYEIIAYVVPGLTKSERKFLAPIVFGSSILFYIGYVQQPGKSVWPVWVTMGVPYLACRCCVRLILHVAAVGHALHS